MARESVSSGSDLGFSIYLKKDLSEPELELWIYDEIGSSSFGEGVSAKEIAAKIADSRDIRTIKVHINSVGGDVSEGVSIYNLLKNHPARVEVLIEGIAASIASVIAMAGDTISIFPGSMIMIHDAWSRVQGNADSMRERADLMEKVSLQIAEIYSQRTGQDVWSIKSMMAKETYMNPEEAKMFGFVDEIKIQNIKKSSSEFLSLIKSEMISGAPEAFLNSIRMAQAGPQELNIQNHAASAPKKEHSDMKILSMLGASDEHEAQEKVKTLMKIEKTTGQSGEEAFGVVMAWKSSSEQLPKVQAELSELRARAEKSELEGAIAKAKADKKLTPALEEKIREHVDSGEISLAGAKAMLSVLSPVTAFASTEVLPDVSAGWNGKSYAELKPSQRAQLKRENPELYEAMRTAG